MGVPVAQSPDIARALAEGARRSEEAQGPGGPASVPALRPSLVPAAFWATPTGLFLVRHKWKFVGLILFLLTDLLLFTLGRTIGMGPQ